MFKDILNNETNYKKSLLIVLFLLIIKIILGFYLDIKNPYKACKLKDQRLLAIRELNLVLAQIKKSKEAIKNVEVRNPGRDADIEIDLQLLIVAALEIVQKFIDNLKYLAKKTLTNNTIGS